MSTVSRKIGIQTREWILARHGEECFYCQRPLSFGSDGNGTFDHLVPECRGGKATVDNLVPACRGCNNKKADRKLVYRNGRVRFLHVGETQVPPLRGMLGYSQGVAA